MKINQKDMAINAIARIETTQKYQAMLGQIVGFVRKNSSKSIDADAIYSVLMEIENRFWRDLMMFGLLLDGGERERVRAAVAGHFLHQDADVSSFLGESVRPSSWMQADEDEFRQMIRDTFGESKKSKKRIARK